MKFRVFRTSLWDDKLCPTANIPIKSEKHYFADNDARYDTYWFVEINTLEQLIDWQKKEQCQLIIGNDEVYNTIEIYDTYRE